MLYPDDEQARSTFAANRVNDLNQSGDFDRGLVAELDAVLSLAESPAQIEKAFLKRAKSADHAGWIVWWVHGTHARGDEDVSFKRAIRERRDFVSPEHRVHGDGSRPNLSERQIRLDFELFRPVAHLWGAACVTYMYANE